MLFFVEEDITAPTNAFEFNETQYSSVLKDAIYNGLLDEVQTGGYGLNPDDEEALWNRERDREAINAQFTIDEVKRNYSMTNFPIPTGLSISHWSEPCNSP